jgi:hypothetical protein
MSEELKIKTLILILVAGMLLTYSSSMPFVNAQPTPTSLTITAPPYYLPEIECTIEAILIDENDNPLQNFDIDFLYECEDHTHPLGTTKTDSNGVASLELTDNPPLFYYPSLSLFETKKTVMYKINAVFDGTTTYAKSSSEDVYVAFVLTDYTSYLVGGGLIVLTIIGAIGYIVFRRRKKAITTSMTTKGEKKMRINPLQIGFSIIIGWIIVLVSTFLQPIIGGAMIWIAPLLGVSFIVLGFIEKKRMISPYRAKTLLQIGVAVTLIWVMLFIQAEGPYDLGLPKLYIPTGSTPNGTPIVTPLALILFLSFPVVGLILLVLGTVLKIRRRVKS